MPFSPHWILRFVLSIFSFFLDLKQGINMMQGLLKKINLGVVGLPWKTKSTWQVLLTTVFLSVPFFQDFFHEMFDSITIIPDQAMMFRANHTVVENIPSDIIKGDLHKPPPVGVLALAVVPEHRLKSIVLRPICKVVFAFWPLISCNILRGEAASLG